MNFYYGFIFFKKILCYRVQENENSEYLSLEQEYFEEGLGWNIFNRYIKLHHSSPMNAFKMYDQTTALKHAQAIPKDFFTVNL